MTVSLQILIILPSNSISHRTPVSYLVQLNIVFHFPSDFGKGRYVNITLHFESSLPLKLRICGFGNK